MVCIIDSCVPTHSSTESAPMPFVRSLIRVMPSSPRSVTISVAPNSRASFCRDSWRLIAIIRSAPICLAESTPSRPTAPSPTTTTVAPGFTLAASAANQPVPRTSEAANRLGTRSSGGVPPGVATSVPSACGTRRNGACALVMNSRWTHDDWYPYWVWASVVRRGERTNNELPRLDGLDRVPDLFDKANVFVPHRRGTLNLLYAPERPQVRSAHAGGGEADHRIRRFDDLRFRHS